MKMLWFFILGYAVEILSAFNFNQNNTRIHGENGWYVPRVDGSFDWKDMDEAESYLEAKENKEKLSLTATPVSFYLHTKFNPTKAEKITSTIESINATYFNPAHPTRFIIHGWIQSHNSVMNKKILNAYLNSGTYNIIIVDWARARSLDYASSVLAVSKVGKKVANLIEFLVNNYKLSLDTLYIVGHSLGAHVAGYAGKNIKTGGKIHTIVGLDPALPLFNYNKPEKRLSSLDAFYVESIQTNGGELGFLKPIGKAAFYPNGGKSQPGCYLDMAGICAHGRSVTYYAESIAQDNFASIKCKNFKDAVAKNCGPTYSSVRMGAEKNALMVAGEFFTPVNKKTPFGILV